MMLNVPSGSSTPSPGGPNDSSSQIKLLSTETRTITTATIDSRPRDYRAPLNQRSSMFVPSKYTQQRINERRKTHSPMTMIATSQQQQQPHQHRLSSNTSHLSLSSTGGARLKTGSAHSKTILPARTRFDDPLYRAKQLKKQRKQDIQKRFNDTAHHHHHHHHHAQKVHKVPRARTVDSTEYKAAECHLTFIFDPNGRFSYWMGFIVSLAFLYNFWVMIYRYSFNEINARNRLYWFSFDYFADFLYICDILFNFRTGFLEEGVLQTDPVRLRHYYMNTTRFYIDCLCLIPLDILYLSIGYNSILRCFRLVKIYRFWEFLDRTERHTNFPNFFRTIVMLHYLFAIFHWNACFTYFLSRYLSDDFVYKFTHTSASSYYISTTTSVPPILSSSSSSSSPHHLFPPGFGGSGGLGVAAGPNNEFMPHFAARTTSFFYADDPSRRSSSSSPSFSSSSSSSASSSSSKFYHHNPNVDLLKEYLKAFYMSTKVMTLVSEMPSPKTSRDYFFAIFQLIFALLLFATIMGHVGYIVSNLGNARKDFQSKLDGVKTYMSLRHVPKRLQDRVIRWFDFLWGNHKSIDDNQILNLLPYKLRAEIAIHVHLDTLKRVEIFQNTEAGFLNELVLRLKPVLYSPGDFICRKGEVGKEMYIVSAGKLQVISDDGKSVLATLRAGSYFGEISILNMGASGNRRTASVKSVGYSDLFCLSKEDLWEVLKEYPAVRVKLEAIAVRRLEKHKLPLSEIVNMKRCKSAPGLLQISLASIPANKNLRRYGTLPATLLKRTDDMSVVMSNPFGTSMSNIKRRHTQKNSTTTMVTIPATIRETRQEVITINEEENTQEQHQQQQQQDVEESIAPTMSMAPRLSISSVSSSATTSCITTNKIISGKTPMAGNNSDLISDDTSSMISRLRDVSLAGTAQMSSLVPAPSYNERVLMSEVDKLKKFVYYLKAENLTLNFKLNKYRQYKADDFDFDVEMAKAKPESSDIDDFKV